MPQLLLHHASIVTRDLERAIVFYREMFGLEPIERPPFTVPGAWLAVGDRQLHLILHQPGTYRSGPIDTADSHFAFRTNDFEGVVARLLQKGFREDVDDSHPMRIFLNRNGLAGFAQLYVLDPDRNIVEVNAAPM